MNVRFFILITIVFHKIACIDCLENFQSNIWSVKINITLILGEGSQCTTLWVLLPRLQIYISYLFTFSRQTNRSKAEHNTNKAVEISSAWHVPAVLSKKTWFF